MQRNYKNIKAWQLADRLTGDIYRATRDFPKEEIYGITSQLRRAAVSVPCNIVEGATRNHDKEYLQFLYIAKGSLSETEYLLYLSNSLGFLKADQYKILDEICQECARTLYGLILAVSKKP